MFSHLVSNLHGNQTKTSLKLNYTWCFQNLYKTQVRELKEEVDEHSKQGQIMQGNLHILQEERDSLSAQLELALAKAESEELARSIAEEQISDLEKEKTILDLEVKDLVARHKADINDKNNQYIQVRTWPPVGLLR